MGGLHATLRRLADAHRTRGIPATAAMAVEEAYGWLRHGSATGGVGETPAGADAERLETTRFRTLRRTLAAVPADLRGSGFVDLGCGRGRALLVARSKGFDPVVGVEVAPRVAAAARRNLAGTAGVEVVEADAATFELPDAVGVVFLFNPFGVTTLAAVLAALDAAQQRRPRSVVVVYVNPLHRDLLEAAGFRPIWQDPDAVVLRRDAPPRGSVQNWNAF